MCFLLSIFPTFICTCTPSLFALQTHMQALSGGSSPALQHFSVDFATLNDEDLTPLADMVEARARIPGCRRLKTFAANWDWLDRGSLATRIRLLRVLLPSLKRLDRFALDPFTWNPAFEPCFIETRPLYLEGLHVKLVDDETVPSRDVLEAALDLKGILLESKSDRRGDRALQPIMACCVVALVCRA